MSELLKGRRLIFYDFEVLSNCKIPETGASYWCVVFIDYASRNMRIIKNNLDELRSFYNTCKNDIFIGYNSRNYDQHILKGLLLGMDAGYINDQLIIHKKKGYQVIKGGNKIQFYNFDCSTGFHSLKQLEAFMGSEIKESDVPFDIDRPLTQDEERDLIKYCVHDVKETIKVFERLRVEFDSHLQLIEAFNLDFTMFTKTKAQLSADILGAVKTDDRGDEFDYRIPEVLNINDYPEVVEWYFNDENKDYKKKLEIDIYGVPHVFAFGGIHGAIPNYQYEGIILCCDVASLYPSMMINFDTLSRNVKEPAKFKEIRDTRLKYKAEKNPIQQPLKIVINGTFGASKDQYNNLYDPKNCNLTCLFGQWLLLDLIEKVAPYCEIIQSNTDGIFMKVEDMDAVAKIKEVAKEWEVRTNLELEWEQFERIYQKDVNNYIIISDDGKYKAKGTYVKKLNDLDYDLPIVNEAMVNYFVHGIPLEETINSCTSLHKFQKVVKLSSAYQYAMKNCTFSKQKVLNETTGKMNTKTMWDDNGEILQDKTFRIFASLDENDGGIFKRKEGKNPEKFANTPEQCFIDNGDVTEKITPDKLDRQFYIDLAQKRVNQFLGISNRKKKEVKE